MINVFLDDLRSCPKGFVPAKEAAECILLLEECEVDVLSLDHDLGWNQPNGFEVVKHMVRHSLYPREIYLHTSDAVGRANMLQHLYLYKPEHIKLYQHPVPWEKLQRIAAEAEQRREENI